MRRFVPLFLLVLILALVGTVFAEDYTGYILCKPDDYVNVRMNPSSDSIVVGRFDCGDSFETDGKTKKDKKGKTWLHVINAHLEVGEAWVCSAYVQESPIIIETAMVTVVSKGRTAIRRIPNGKVNKWVHNCDDLKIFARSSEWALTSRGYISMECVEVWHD